MPLTPTDPRYGAPRRDFAVRPSLHTQAALLSIKLSVCPTRANRKTGSHLSSESREWKPIQ